jgi:NADP-dependent 3-hydroxy acid dehydrogenase YdfG
MTSKQRVALITGCGAPSGIGSCIALELANRGYRVFATARRIEQMAHLMGTCELLSLDVTAQESIEAAVSVVRSQTGGRLSVLVNNVRR